MALTQLSCCRSVCSTCKPHSAVGEVSVAVRNHAEAMVQSLARVLYLKRRGVDNGHFAGPARDKHVLAVGRELLRATAYGRPVWLTGRSGQTTDVHGAQSGELYLKRRRAPRHDLRPHQQAPAILQAPHNQLAARRVQHYYGSIAQPVSTTIRRPPGQERLAYPSSDAEIITSAAPESENSPSTVACTMAVTGAR